MTDEFDEADDSGTDRALERAGRRVRSRAHTIDAAGVPLAVLRRRNKRLQLCSAALALVVFVGAVVAVVGNVGSSSSKMALGRDTVAPADLDAFLASLPDKPEDPTKVHLVAAVQSFPGCDALIGDLRAVGARHVGSRGFGESFGSERFMKVSAAIGASDEAASTSADKGAGAPSGGETLGTNVQVTGVDELDQVKAVGKLIYDLDGKGNLRITDADDLKVLSTTAVADPIAAAKGKGNVAEVSTAAASLLVANDRIAVFGSQSETSKPVSGDPSATQSTTEFLTVTLIDASDPAHPKITDRVKIEGSLVAARLVGGQIRLVTTSHMADIGMVMPTTPASIPTALERNRRSVASSTVADWIPDWQRSSGQPEPLVPCDRVHVPETFAGVAMTSMVTFPIGTGRFDPAGTSIVAPATTLYAGLDKVAVSSNVWVDPADRQRLHFDDWQTAIHEFTFPKSGAPAYVGSGIVDGSTVGQFAFGEVGDAISVVSSKGTPWDDRGDDAVDLTLLTSEGKGKLAVASKIDDLADGHGEVTAVRYLDDRVLISTGTDGRDVQVIDLSDLHKPRRAGKVSLAGPTGYFHPLGGDRALLVGSRTDTVPGAYGPITRPWVQAELLDVSDADNPKVTGTWEEPWAADQVGSDHHAFTYWPSRKLALWGIQNQRFDGDQPNQTVALATDGSLTQAALPNVSKAPEMPAPCPAVSVPGSARQMIPENGVVLECAKGTGSKVEWPRYQCNTISTGMVRQVAPDLAGKADYVLCTPAPWPAVQRVLVVDGRVILMTDQTLEALDPTTFASQNVVYHPTSGQAVPIGYATD